MTEHGMFHWNELNTSEPKRACEFYAATLGWTFEALPTPGFEYYVAKRGDKMVCGVFEMKGPDFAGIPNHWIAYIAVDDVDARVAKALAAGGAVRRPAWDAPGVGRIAVVADPTGAAVGWMTPARRG